jgi:long-chain fatty acid transport protein
MGQNQVNEDGLGNDPQPEGQTMKSCMWSAIVVAQALALSSTAMAGGFALREQSTIGQGSSFAGVAAGSGGLSSLFWNPAISSEYNEFGFISENNAALVAPYSKSNLGSGNIGALAVVPAGYFSYGVTDQLTIATSTNSPFGLTTDGNDGWAGSLFGDKSAVRTYNFNPTASYKFNDMFSVGIGAQIQYMTVDLTTRAPGSGAQLFQADGDDLGFGFTAGVLFEPTDTTDIGIGFRSSIAHTLKGDARIGAANPGISAKFKSPETVTLGLRQQVTDQVTIMGGVEWANWSRFKELRIVDQASGAAIAATPFEWKDSWYFSAGAEYAHTDALTLRGGVAYEKSPVPDSTRSVRVPDNDRYWLSLGASYKFTDTMTANLAYSHVIIKDGDVAALNTTFKQHLNIVSIGLTRDW